MNRRVVVAVRDLFAGSADAIPPPPLVDAMRRAWASAVRGMEADGVDVGDLLRRAAANMDAWRAVSLAERLADEDDADEEPAGEVP